MNANSNLARLRGGLDHIDNQLLDLLEQRLLLCSAIGRSKEKSADLHLRPKRQDSLVQRLQARAKIASPDAVRHVWREIMAHSLQLQTSCAFVLIRSPDSDRILRHVRDRFGSAGPIEWADSKTDALARASEEEIVAVLPHASDIALPDKLKAFHLLSDEKGEPLAWAVGRIANEDCEGVADQPASYWIPASWRSRSSSQLPVYSDLAALSKVERQLAQRAPIVEYNDVVDLRRQIGAVADGRAIILQAGDCAETFASDPNENIRGLNRLLDEMATIIEGAASRDVVRIGRVAGQLAKPRTNLTECLDGRLVPTYRGDAINGADPQCRDPDPSRMLLAYEHSECTASWLTQNVPAVRRPLYTSHEGLLLHYEEALTHFDERSGNWWSGSGHLLWIGDRTRQPGGAHAEYMRGIANPIAVKCGPSMEPEDLLGLLEVLDPHRTPGRLTLIPRLGHKQIESKLPALMRTAMEEGWNLPWVIDPMHGNTQLVGSLKTRDVAHVRAEIVSFFDIARAEDVWPGGAHLELTFDEVTECFDGKHVTRANLKKRYTTACDPRLNREQALEVAGIVAEQYRRHLQRETNRCA